MEGRRREGVVVVVPGLAERQQRQPTDVGRLVVRLEAPAAEEVADRVDAEGGVVQEEDAREPAPHQRQEGTGQGSLDRQADQEGDRQAGDDQRLLQRVDHAQPAVPEQVGAVAAAIGLAHRREQPPHVGMPQPPSRAQRSGSSVVRAVRVAVLVGEVVVLAMVGDPLDDRSLDRQGAEHRQRVADGGVGLKGAVRQEPVEPHRDPQAGERVPDGQDGDVQRLDHATPEQHHGKADDGRRKKVEQGLLEEPAKRRASELEIGGQIAGADSGPNCGG